MAGRPPSSVRSRPQSSAMRAPTASRPGTKSGQVPGGGSIFGTGIMVAERPMTQQGLGGMRTANKGQRLIQDRTYWLGEIRSKSTELSSEIRKIEAEIVQQQEENNTYLMFEKRAETLASELSNLQGELHDYNLMIDRINLNRDISEMVEDLNALKVQNEREAEALEKIFEEKEKAEKEIARIDKQVLRQQTLTENRVQDMNKEMKAKYSKLKHTGLQTMEELNKLQNEIDELSSKQADLENDVQHDIMKLEAVKLFQKLNELTEKEDQLKEEEKARLSPEEEQKRLLASVKADNSEISTMDRQTKELDEKIRVMSDELTQIEGELEDQQSEATDKFRQLQKRENTIDEFMTSFSDTKIQEMQEQSQLQGSIVALLEQISKTIEFGQNVPSQDRLQALKDDLQFKESELQKAESTSTSLLGQSAKLQEDLNKVEELEGKIETEKATMIEDIERMEKEMEEFKKTDELKTDGEKIKKELRKEKEMLEKSKAGQKQRQQEMAEKYNALVKSLEENETHAQLANLEKKWKNLEQNNFAMKEFISSKSVDCDAVKEKVLKTITDTNRLLQDLYTKSSLLT